MNKKTELVLEAVLLGDIGALRKALAEGCNPNMVDRAGRTALANAVIGEDSEMVEMLLGAGANPNTPDKQGFTPLHHAAQRHTASVVKSLIAAGAIVDARDSFGNTPLFRAVFESRGRGETLLVLLDAGANQHARNDSGMSPRDLATSIANFDVLSLLPDE